MSTPSSQSPSPQPSSAAAKKTAATATKTATESADATLTATEPSFGWNQYSEKLNGRFAMMGFIALLALEFFTRQDFFTWIGL